ncbi:MAG: M48 family metalloprotease, partial [Ardenticatenaceae bacterium]
MRALLRTEQQKGRVGAIRHRWEPVALVAALLPLLVWLAISGIGTLGATAGLFGMGLLTVVLELERTRAQLLGHGLRSRAEEAPVVQQAVAACSALAPLRRPVEVLIVQNPALQAFTFGLGRCAVIVLTSGLVQSLPPRELTAVIAHEWGHLALGHTVVMNLLGTAGTLTSLRRVAAPVLPGHRSQATIVPAGPDGARALLLS